MRSEVLTDLIAGVVAFGAVVIPDDSQRHLFDETDIDATLDRESHQIADPSWLRFFGITAFNLIRETRRPAPRRARQIPFNMTIA